MVYFKQAITKLVLHINSNCINNSNEWCPDELKFNNLILDTENLTEINGYSEIPDVDDDDAKRYQAEAQKSNKLESKWKVEANAPDDDDDYETSIFGGGTKQTRKIIKTQTKLRTKNR